MEIYASYIKFAEENDLQMKFYGSDSKFIDKMYLVKELNPHYISNNSIPLLCEPTKYTVKKHLLYESDDDKEIEEVEFWIQTVVGKSYARWFSNGGNIHIVIWAKTIKQIDQFTSYLESKHQHKNNLGDGFIYEWSKYTEQYVNTQKKCINMQENNLIGLEDFFEKIELDLTTLEKHKDMFERLGATNGFSYLLHGPPGTGKTSCIKALAHKYNRAIFCVNLNEVDSSRLNYALSPNINGINHPIILVEDFDRYLATGDGQKKVSQLLNALDGVTPSYFAIRFFSANMVDKFDNAALITRMRRLIHFPAPSAAHIMTHLRNLFGEASDNTVILAERCNERNLSIRTVNHYITRFLMDDDPIKSAVEQLDEWFSEMDKIVVCDDSSSNEEEVF